MGSPIPFLDSLGQAASSLGKADSGAVESFKWLQPNTPVAVHTLLRDSKVGVVDFANTLQILKENGFVRHYGAGPDEVVELTDEGAQMLRTGG
jgi:hypothetical protein